MCLEKAVWALVSIALTESTQLWKKWLHFQSYVRCYSQVRSEGLPRDLLLHFYIVYSPQIVPLIITVMLGRFSSMRIPKLN